MVSNLVESSNFDPNIPSEALTFSFGSCRGEITDVDVFVTDANNRSVCRSATGNLRELVEVEEND